ncbi:hypothetical protein QO010_000738 [Caulobacter ginsengisoli]|uniref:Uncharacterized protein n=1 Tax=Caulobacter ginsengisoli TaxID=400775 RepID=A0ABU0INH7_9CAUL|nr:hypothetical protein [Caulobacter ginsengisoli]MDQ0462990.1 hypothetical protein [Caulobacter ginsengisoli]
MITAVTAVLAVYLGIDQLNTARQLQAMDSAYNSWNNLNQATLANPELACPNTEEAFQRLMTAKDPKSPIGGTYNDRYTAYGYMLATTSEQILEMAPGDKRWEFLIAERMRCNAPALRYIQKEGTYEKRYSCRLRRVIATALDQPPVACAGKGD